MEDIYNLRRFVDAQSAVYDQVCTELRDGRKTSHWIWFVFPQILGLGQSPMAIRYAIASLDEARAYLQDPLLGPRLQECSEVLLHVDGKSIREIMGYPDDLKLRSSMTLFSQATGGSNPLFLAILGKYFNDEQDAATLGLLQRLEKAT